MLEVKDNVLKGTKPKVVSEAFIEVWKGANAYSVSCMKAKDLVLFNKGFHMLYGEVLTACQLGTHAHIKRDKTYVGRLKSQKILGLYLSIS